jgi:23S rRNA (uracil1939-C5)-methyltransferase
MKRVIRRPNPETKSRAVIDSQPIQLTIEKAIYGGAGLAHAPADDTARGGKAIFIPMTLPGEVVEAEITAEKKQFANARLLRVLEPATGRVDPRCKHFGVCGGCDYQYADAKTQLAMKKNILRETLERAGLAKLQMHMPKIETHATDAWEYRNRVRMHTLLLEGRIRLGYTRANSNAVVPVEECPITAPLLLKAAKAVEKLAYEDRNIFNVLHVCSEVEFFCDAGESQLQVTLTNQEGARTVGLESFEARLCEHMPTLRSVAWRGYKSAAEVLYSLHGEEYNVPHGAFFQANRKLLPKLVECVTQGRSGRVAWDLYAGVGLFASVLAKQFTELVAVESAPGATAALRENLRGASAKCSVRHSDTLSFLRVTAAQKMATPDLMAPDLVVLDPPRTGLGAEVCTLLATIAPTEIVYVSCDPATMARDLASLISTGWHCDSLHLFDMFPQTSHIESVAVLKR